jgi:hypothetical protein
MLHHAALFRCSHRIDGRYSTSGSSSAHGTYNVTGPKRRYTRSPPGRNRRPHAEHRHSCFTAVKKYLAAVESLYCRFVLATAAFIRRFFSLLR